MFPVCVCFCLHVCFPKPGSACPFTPPLSPALTRRMLSPKWVPGWGRQRVKSGAGRNRPKLNKNWGNKIWTPPEGAVTYTSNTCRSPLAVVCLVSLQVTPCSTLYLVIPVIRNIWNSQLLQLETFATQNICNSKHLQLKTCATQSICNSKHSQLKTFATQNIRNSKQLQLQTITT